MLFAPLASRHGPDEVRPRGDPPPAISPWTAMTDRRRGFTVIELVIVLMVGALLTGIAFRSLNGVQGKMAARQARLTFASMHARTRAQAIEMAATTQLNVDMDKDSVWVQRGTTRVETIRFRESLGVDILGSGAIRLCMNPRGFAETACNSFTTTQTVTFKAGNDTSSVQIRTLGQLYY
jgi:prepilin-type N-terminal cleavage/methylation domain-containing protein